MVCMVLAQNLILNCIFQVLFKIKLCTMTKQTLVGTSLD